ncbi:hypothetical protein [Paractinoplanes maris]|uniref:hypothetical protein n=1 Tax=Paractinoplanes maris TaxID=1734446 RepID=UPI00201FFEAA|nr:hypothetical protein [Actinoplanes maris]
MRSTWLFFSVILAVLSGAAQLVASGVGTALFAVLCAASLSFLLYRLSRDRLSARFLQLKSERDALMGALHHVTVSADASFSEQLSLTFEVGENSSDDLVHQIATTTPRNALNYRAFYPVVPNTRETPEFKSMSLKGRVLNPLGTNLEILPVLTDRWIRVLAIFRPEIKSPCRWLVDYKSPGLWDPLRVTGHDTLTWQVRRNPAMVEADSINITLEFVPPENRMLSVAERKGRGEVKTKLSSAKGVTIVVWQAFVTGSDLFVFDVTME